MKAYKWIVLMVVASSLIVTLSIFSWIPGIPAQKALAQSPGRSYGVVTTDELLDMLKTKDFTLVNVHVPYQGELPQTDAFIPYDKVDKYLDWPPADKNAKIVLYCRTDRMSMIAAKKLVELGYTNVWYLKGGMQEWRQKGYPLLNATF